MFVRKKTNKSGVISVQVIEKRAGKSVLIKTIGIPGMQKKLKTYYKKASDSSLK